MRPAVFLFALALTTTASLAATPEIERAVGTPQANGVTHLVRGIPEACAWLEGTFTGNAASPYRFQPVRSSPSCQARARLLDPSKAQPSEAKGWKLNDLIRVPSKDCPGLQAVVEVWRKPTTASAPQLDAQGRARIYLKDAHNASQSAPAAYTAKVALEGKPCG
ncbi:hypothetical protein [Cognatilysobacter lacus]|uniref:Secreted protein n=1 Tax=Cognatilysobacter lacus TaxID=1643323 RepID=A0A5D8Z8B8_9GAMM|nr:hypothetical protein [Lysobacter lacus]TZF90917.1 hypothetical protein FW784_03420 [Lysobacter lacus]